MGKRIRRMDWLLGLGLLPALAGCVVVPRSQLVACQRFNCELQRKYHRLASQGGVDSRQLADENRRLQEQLAEQDRLIASLQTSLAQYQRAAARPGGGPAATALAGGPASRAVPVRVQQQLDQFARRYADLVEVDARAGISKFKSDVLFGSGEAELTPEAAAALQEFAAILQSPEARPLKIMVVGHTDKQPIARPATRARHQTNWHLSSHRAIAVARFLQKAGVQPARMGVVGYGPYQPLVAAETPEALAKNRRVEVYVMGPDVPVVGRVDMPARF